MTSTRLPSTPHFTYSASETSTRQFEVYDTANSDSACDLPFHQHPSDGTYPGSYERNGTQYSHVYNDGTRQNLSGFGGQFVAGGRQSAPEFPPSALCPLPQGTPAQRPGQLSPPNPPYNSLHDWTRVPEPGHLPYHHALPSAPGISLNGSNPGDRDQQTPRLDMARLQYAHQGPIYNPPHPPTNPGSQQLPPLPPSSILYRAVPTRGVKNPQIHRCPECTTKFTRVADLRRHEKQFHEHTRHYHCTTVGCSASNRRRDKIIDHCRKKHNGHMTIIEIDDTIPRQFGCPIRDDCIEMLNQVDRVGTGHGRGRTRASQR